MRLEDEPTNYYELLELTPGATPQEIRSAYLRLKAAYSKDSVALYSIMDKEDTERMATRIEEAYLILSQSDKRQAYDKAQGLISPNHSKASPPLDLDDPFQLPPETQHQASVTSPVASIESNIHILPTSKQKPITEPTSNPLNEGSLAPDSNINIEEEIKNETVWSGEFLTKVREAKRISIDDLSDFTKISKIYLKSIESEDYAKLPAAVYLRGFLIQLAKRLGLPQDTFPKTYLDRFKQSRPDKA